MAIVFDRSLRNRVNPSGVPGVASEYSLHAKVSAAGDPEFIDRLVHILRARRGEPAGSRQDRGKNELIDPDQSHG